MKHSLLFSLLFSLGIFQSLAGTYTIPGTTHEITYANHGTYIEITRCSTNVTGSLDIPATLDGLPVTHLGPGSFEFCRYLTSITVPDTVTTIGESAFQRCYGLISITIPNSVTTIGVKAFAECIDLVSVNIVNGDATIASEAFRDCSQLVSVTLPSNLIVIENSLFSGCENLSSLVIPSTVKTIGSSAFRDTGFIQIIIPDAVTSIGNGAFSYNENLTSITLPSNLLDVFTWWFEGSINLYEINIGASSTRFASLDGVLFNKDQTELLIYPKAKAGAYTIPATVELIAEYAFHNIAQLSEITIPNSVITISDSAFTGCSALQNVSLPSSLSSFGENVFYQCSSLDQITVDQQNVFFSSLDGVLYNKSQSELILFPEGKGGTFIVPSTVTHILDYAFYYSLNLNSVILPNGLESIGRSAFESCRSLERLRIPSTVVSIGHFALLENNNIKSILFEGDVPSSVGSSLVGGVFIGVPDDFTFYYYPTASGFTTPTWTPSGTTNTYKCEPLPYAVWAQSHGLAGDNTGNGNYLAEPANDGISNLMKYALGLDPAVSYESTALPTSTQVGADLLFTYLLDTSKNDITYTVQSSTDLVNWVTSAFTDFAVATNGNVETHEVTIPMSVDAQFIRLHVEGL